MNLHTPVNDHYKIAFIGNYRPRRCGLATFTTDLCESIALAAGENADCFAVPMNDVPEGYAYPERVRFEVRQHAAREDYLMAADCFNLNQVDVVCLQHEYGIFGGSYGSFILDLLAASAYADCDNSAYHPEGTDRLSAPDYSGTGQNLRPSAVMSHPQQFLEDIYKIPSEKIVYIPHGIPDVPLWIQFYKDQFGVRDAR